MGDVGLIPVELPDQDAWDQTENADLVLFEFTY